MHIYIYFAGISPNTYADVEYKFFQLERTELLPKVNHNYNKELMEVHTDYAKKYVVKTNTILPKNMNIANYSIEIIDSSIVDKIRLCNPFFNLESGYKLFRKSFGNDYVYIIIHISEDPYTFFSVT